MSKRSFNLIRAASYFWPVAVEFPADGKIVTETFDAEFRVLTQAEVEACFADRESKIDDVLKRILVGWRGVVAGAEPVEFSPANLNDLLEVVGMRSFILKAWIASVTGEAARKGN